MNKNRPLVKLRSTSGLYENMAFVLNRKSLADLSKEDVKRKKIRSNRICLECGCSETYVTKQGYPVWFKHPISKEEWVCSRCFQKIKTHMKSYTCIHKHWMDICLKCRNYILKSAKIKKPKKIVTKPLICSYLLRGGSSKHG